MSARRTQPCCSSLTAGLCVALMVWPSLPFVAAFVPSTLVPHQSTRPWTTPIAHTTRRTKSVACSMGGMESLDISTLLSSMEHGAWLSSMSSETAEALAGPFFGLSLFPYLAFLYFLNVPANNCPKGVTVGFASCLLFVALTIPAAIVAKVWYGTSLANCDWLHGSAESMLTITNLATVIPFRQALAARESKATLPLSATTYAPTVGLVAGWTMVAIVTALVPALSNPTMHTPYLNGCLDFPWINNALLGIGAHAEPDNALTVATWIIHVSSLVEFLVVMGFCWKWADVVNNPTWKGLTWGLLPLHSSGITACVSHLLYNQVAILVPLQALLTCIGNTTAAYAAYRIARSNGWTPQSDTARPDETVTTLSETMPEDASMLDRMIGFEDLGEALANDNDFTFLLKLFAGCALFSYVIKYGELFFDAPFDASLPLGLALIAVPSALNAYKWNRRSNDATFDGWF